MKSESVLFIGEAPGKTAIPLGHEHLALREGAGRNLAKIAGWTWDEYIDHAARRNLFYVPTTNEQWSKPMARVNAAWLLGEWSGTGIPIICLGIKVKEAMEPSLRGETLAKYGWVFVGEEVDREGMDGKMRHYDFRTKVGYMPHPSGRNRVWNDPDEMEAARRYLHDLL